jgi:serine/threonine protein kinase
VATVDDSTLIGSAAKALAVTVDRDLRPGGQKLVVLVRRGGDPAVLKVVRVNPGTTNEALKRAHREVSLLEEIDHPNVVKVLSGAHELGSPAHAICWLEEYLDGNDLRDLVGTPWSWDDARALGIDLAGALCELHERGVVHRDLSAGNVRRVADGHFVLLDPGFARHLNLSGLTHYGQPGTPGHMSPEHVQLGVAPSRASDVFGAGILLWLALTAELPIPCLDVATYVEALRSSQAPSIATKRPDLDSAAVRLVDRCLERQLARRFFDAQELARELSSL